MAQLALVGCAPARSADDDDDDDDTGSNEETESPAEVPEPDPDAFFAEDPPPQYCGPDGEPSEPAELPGGTPECPDDKNREGCPCDYDQLGQEAPCWPGLRVNRNRGICQDGVTVCQEFNEFSGAWGACEGYVLPEEGAELGPGACRCFSEGRWQIDNVVPCTIEYPDGFYTVSTFIDERGSPQCPTDLGQSPPPDPEPGHSWSTSRLTVDCAGRFELCYTLRAGDIENPSEDDCVVAHVCTEAWVEEAGVEQELPPLPGWSSDDPRCSAEFARGAGYAELSVLGLSVECDEIAEDGDHHVFLRIGYCPMDCHERPDDPDCIDCGQGGSGEF
jgi:hypothetical protein